jgi:hypothetical protein
MVTAFGTHSDLQRRFVSEDPLRSATFLGLPPRGQNADATARRVNCPPGRPGGRCNFDFAMVR